MEARKAALIQASFEKIEAMGERASEIFYAELFEIEPSMRAMFSGDMTQQHRKLLASLRLVISTLHRPEKLLGDIEALAVRHVAFGVRPNHYTYFGNALLRTLRRILGSEFNAELCEVWTDAFLMLARVMQDAAYRRAPAPVRAAG